MVLSVKDTCNIILELLRGVKCCTQRGHPTIAQPLRLCRPRCRHARTVPAATLYPGAYLALPRRELSADSLNTSGRHSYAQTRAGSSAIPTAAHGSRFLLPFHDNRGNESPTAGPGWHFG